MPDANLIPHRSEDVATQAWDGGIVLVQSSRGLRHRLTGVAARFWELVNGRDSLEAIAEQILSEYDVPRPKLLSDLHRLLEDLHRAGLVHFGTPVPVVPTPVVEQRKTITGGDRPVFRIELELTHRCNLSCKHCFLSDAPPCAELSTNEIVEIIDQLGNSGCAVVNFTGGEPTLRPDLPDLVAEARLAGMTPTLITNGTRITPQLADRLAKAGIAQVEVSLHGATATTHDGFCRVPGSFKQLLVALDLLREHSIPCSVMYVVTKDNFHEYRKAYFTIGPRVSSMAFSPLVYPTLKGDCSHLTLRLPDDQLASLMRDGFFRPVARVCSIAAGEGRIAPDGTLFPCGFVTEPLGRLRDTTFAELWSSPLCSAYRESPRFTCAPEACESCENKDICPRCPGLAYLETREWDKPHPECCRITRLYRKVMSDEL